MIRPCIGKNMIPEMLSINHFFQTCLIVDWISKCKWPVLNVVQVLLQTPSGIYIHAVVIELS